MRYNLIETLKVLVFVFIAILPWMIYIALKKPMQDGFGLGILGYLIIKTIRRKNEPQEERK